MDKDSDRYGQKYTIGSDKTDTKGNPGTYHIYEPDSKGKVAKLFIPSNTGGSGFGDTQQHPASHAITGSLASPAPAAPQDSTFHPTGATPPVTGIPPAPTPGHNPLSGIAVAPNETPAAPVPSSHIDSPSNPAASPSAPTHSSQLPEGAMSAPDETPTLATPIAGRMRAIGPDVGGGQYTVVHGDTMSGIAQANGVSLSDVIAANPGIQDPNLIMPGQQINLPEGQQGAVAPVADSGPTFPTSSTYATPDPASQHQLDDGAAEKLAGWANVAGEVANDPIKGVIDAAAAHVDTDPTKINDGKHNS